MVERMFAYFRNSELGIIALALDEEEEKVEKRRQKRGRRKWVHSTWKTRPVQEEFWTLFPHLMDDETKFYQCIRMTQSTFYQLLNKLDIKLKKKNTFCRLPITSKERLAISLR
ncbi:hypothetical protein NQ314_019927 [Rhamnusium bicolor]|uniref:Transposase n=1 Tax=Rhamnusium bicolor TaxID=1586634 RepID=A0AAV8WN47_9CUCU|nr:hypothetical protein NQ314_019927 [Rhamnusium bicolor]